MSDYGHVLREEQIGFVGINSDSRGSGQATARMEMPFPKIEQAGFGRGGKVCRGK